MNTMQTIGSIVVGVDDSEGARAAISWAATTARTHHWPVTLAHAYPSLAYTAVSDVIPPEVDLRGDADRVIDRAEDQVRSEGCLETVSTVVRAGAPDRLLRELGAESRLVVVGRRGTGGFRDMLIGSTAYGVAEHRVATHGDVPVVIVPEHWDPTEAVGKPVVLALDEESGDAAVAFAFDVASRTGERLEAIHVYAPPVYVSPVGFGGYWPALDLWTATREEALDEWRRQMSEQLAGWREKYPDVAVTETVVSGYPAGVLLERAGEASLLVVGGRDHGRLASVLVGSVARNVMHHATCPLAVVHAPPR